MKGFMYVLGTVALLSACATAPAENTAAIVASAVPPSSKLKGQIVNDARDFLIDPYSVRDAEISYVGTFANGVQGVCVKANAKNAMGGYVGREAIGISIKNGALIATTKNHPLCFDPNLKWQRFPELEAL